MLLLLSIEFLVVVFGGGCYRGGSRGCVGGWEGGFEILLPIITSETLVYQGKETYQRKFGGVFRMLNSINWKMGVQSMA